MDFGFGGNGSSDDHEETSSNSRRGRKNSNKQYHRHTSEQIQQLEIFFKECPHPDENQRQQLSRNLGLEPKQIKFWFQNKRTQTKAQNERADNNTLRRENERIHCENLVMGEALKKVTCPKCGDSPFGEEDKLQNVHQLRSENERLREEYTRFLTMLASISGKPVSQIQQVLSPALGPLSHDKMREGILGGGIRNPSVDPELLKPKTSTTMRNPFHNSVQENEKSLMLETATRALDELMELLRLNEPIWMNSASDPGSSVIHRDSYNKLFPRPNRLTSLDARFESSRDSVVVPMNALELVEMLLHPTDWADLFPTMVTKAKTLEILDTGNLGGTLHLMYKQMHVLSPLVPPRDIFFLRHCRQLDSSSWILVDVSYDCHTQIQEAFPIRCWRLPSGCMIQNLSNGNSKVTWAEHVEVDDKALTHGLFREFVCGSQAYGARLWLANLQRTCERIAYSRGLSPPHPRELEGVFNVPDGRRNVMKLANKLVKKFCAMLTMSDSVDLPQLAEMYNKGVRYSFRKSTDPSHTQGTVIGAAASFWLPLPCETLFNFFKDEHTRPQWDVLSNGNPINEITHIPCGTHAANSISILKLFVPNKESMVVLQESCIDPVGALVVYAPIEVGVISTVLGGLDIENIHILPSGFTISSTDGRQMNENGETSSSSSSIKKQSPPGSVITIAFQVLLCDTATNQINMESVAAVNGLISSTVQRIKDAFKLADLD